MVELTYEGYGPGGVAVMVECMTDNRNRTAAAVRHAFSKCGGNLGTDGSVAYLFERKGQISFAPGTDEDALMEAAMEADADDVVTNEDGSIDVTSPRVCQASACRAQRPRSCWFQRHRRGNRDAADHQRRVGLGWRAEGAEAAG